MKNLPRAPIGQKNRKTVKENGCDKCWLVEENDLCGPGLNVCFQYLIFCVVSDECDWFGRIFSFMFQFLAWTIQAFDFIIWCLEALDIVYDLCFKTFINNTPNLFKDQQFDLIDLILIMCSSPTFIVHLFK